MKTCDDPTTMNIDKKIVKKSIVHQKVTVNDTLKKTGIGCESLRISMRNK